MARRKSKVTGIVTAIMLIVLLAGIVGASVWLAKSCRNESETFGVKINGTLFAANAGGLVFDKTTTLVIENPSPDGYAVKIYPKAAKDDFTFTVGDEKYKWSDTLAIEFTDGFTITSADNGCTISYINLATVIAKTLRYDYGDIRVPDVPAGDLFVLRITSGDDEVALDFTLSDLGGNVSITEITLSIGGIIFGG